MFFLIILEKFYKFISYLKFLLYKLFWKVFIMNKFLFFNLYIFYFSGCELFSKFLIVGKINLLCDCILN